MLATTKALVQTPLLILTSCMPVPIAWPGSKGFATTQRSSAEGKGLVWQKNGVGEGI